MARGLATMLGEAMPGDAAEETAAAWGMITADLPADVREHRIDVVNALADNVLAFEQLAATARTVDPPGCKQPSADSGSLRWSSRNRS